MKKVFWLLVLSLSVLVACTSTDGNLQTELDAAQSEVERLQAEVTSLQDAAAAHEGIVAELEKAAEAHEAMMADDDMAEEPMMMVTENVIYGFGTDGITIIDPVSGKIVNQITDLGEVSWRDPIASPDNAYVFVNETNSSQVWVIDTAKQEIVKQIDVGPRPVHIYNPNHGPEIWTHSDEEGNFYVIDIASLEVVAVVDGSVGGTGHGKLVYGEGIGSKAYATNTNEPAIHIIDMATYEMTGSIELCKTEEGEGGTHSKAYSEVSGHVYIECTRTGQTVIVDPKTDTVIGELEGRGQLYPYDGDKYIAIMNKGEGLVQVIDTSKNEIIAAIEVEGGADKINFHEQDGVIYGFTANTLVPDAAVINFSEMTLVKRVAAGDIFRPENARFLHRGGTYGIGYVALPASGDGIVSIIDASTQTLHAAVPVEGAGRVLFVGAHE